jgi:hypothetical protein
MREAGTKGIERAVRESAMLGYMMGEGYSYQEAVQLIEGVKL